MKPSCLFFFFCLTSAGSPAETIPADKSGFTLLHPTPTAQMREMTTDRPDATESPFTVDAGHVQVEMDLASFAGDRHNSDRTDSSVEAWAFASSNFRIGLLTNLELQFIVEPWTTIRTADRVEGVSRQRGFGDLTVRGKLNLWGNDEGRTAGAVMPFVRIPTSQDEVGSDSLEGGLIIPFAMTLTGSLGLGAMTEIDFIEDLDRRGYHAEWINTLVIGTAVTERLGAYLELISTVSSERSAPWVGAIGIGGTFAVTNNIQLDAGVNIGFTRAADDINPFVGCSWRF